MMKLRIVHSVQNSLWLSAGVNELNSMNIGVISTRLELRLCLVVPSHYCSQLRFCTSVLNFLNQYLLLIFFLSFLSLEQRLINKVKSYQKASFI